ncbi:hypothetical protein ASC64_15555 [Nocardioides sp. Root122]|uniref:DUF6049 family protein n=1 Tax=Nocardioides TaxID=1839 RepID=UPI0007038461|nr:MULTISPECIES: DUF6049 family protein [Nocardioides]KQV64199.1 hypothetical protein ASC64_15555 [Nocardioides sp. Root122]MCK9825179.1 DUF6049 family protein [Nocardioides cavernae]
MPRPSSFRAALAGLLTLGLASGWALAPATAAPAEEGDPLVVHIDSISPVLPRTGDVEITGTVTNVSDATYTRVNLHAFSSASPILDSTQLAVSAATEASATVGDRVTVPGTFDTIDELAPGSTETFSDSIPVELLPASGDQGVYWIGVHALGDTAEVPRDTVADGRARTFIPARPTGGQTQEASVILSIRGRVWYAADGSLGGTERWARRLAEGGSLDGVLDMAESAGSTPYTWLVDPAVLHAIARLTGGNVPRGLGPDTSVPGQEPTEEEPAGDGEETPAPSQTLAPVQPGQTGSADEELVAAANDWFARFTALVGTQTVLTLPYGDLDVSAAVRNDPDRYDEAVARGSEIMGALSLRSQAAVAPLDGHLSPEALARVAPGTTVLLADTAFAPPPSTPSSVVRLFGREVFVTSSGAESGGPGPTAADDPLALRQRLLSEAALRVTSGDDSPLVVTLPTVWRGEDAQQFFADLDQPWLDVVPFEDVADGVPVDVPESDLAYLATDVEDELSPTSFSAATRASDAAAILEDVLTLQTTIETQVGDEVLVTLSSQHRPRPGLAIAAAGRTEDAIRAELGKITVEAPKAVTLASDNGPLGATLVNGLDQPVTVKLVATTDGQLTLTGGGVRELGPEARSAVRFEASTRQAGVHQVRLAVTTVDGVPLGSVDELPIRAARVSAIIWIVMAVGALVLLGMIGYRLPRQVRARRAERAAAERAETERVVDGEAPDEAGTAEAPARPNLEPRHP